MLFTSRVRVMVRVRIRLRVWLVSRYAHIFVVLLSVVIVTMPFQKRTTKFTHRPDTDKPAYVSCLPWDMDQVGVGGVV